MTHLYGDYHLRSLARHYGPLEHVLFAYTHTEEFEAPHWQDDRFETHTAVIYRVRTGDLMMHVLTPDAETSGPVNAAQIRAALDAWTTPGIEEARAGFAAWTAGRP
ncbi:hypothetical protein [Deinococcus soli (ex Cha et al. 2016)]|uniref:Uncharacterized protein n=2 Tax=Deinococcus soli (ex Cha et al. 2016) TaxID=1309411 RepID=A0AAE3XDE9_9DEIO|nr:hypothetical protein [Deinococcus soli (ex Cha et al. 2016)]MDR6218843.1 hypothetical protein [Deinococcus soli (ex Cha et al. 2016)]MDR6328640.1 hypothetical protein [Deinococcus soli (ex Cha et al. 2016)]MDR6751873.1 hypothetical protein [Deinococcus soli (ex Cha et al. 2016)]